MLSRTKSLGAFTLLVLTQAGVANGQPLVREDIKLLPPEGIVGDRFGTSVGISDGVVVVGKSGNNSVTDDFPVIRDGGAFLFDAATGDLLHELLPPAGDLEPYYGSVVAIDNGIAAVLHPGNDDIGPNAGAIYLFDVTTGAHIRTIYPPNLFADSNFSGRFIMQDGYLAVTSRIVVSPLPSYVERGVVHVFDVSTGQESFRFVPDDGSDNASFGSSLAIGDGVIAVGAHYDDDNGTNSGSVYLFELEGEGEQILKLVPTDITESDEFGASVSIGDGYLAVGAPDHEDDNIRSGCVYLFDLETGDQVDKLLPFSREFYDRIGQDVRIGGGLLVVGAPSDNGIYNRQSVTASGIAYVYYLATRELLFRVSPTVLTYQGRFATNIALDGMTLVGGEAGNNDFGYHSGAAYINDLGAICPADVNRDWILNPADFTAWINAFNNSLPECDQNGDDVCTPTDFTAWLNNFAQPCP